MVTHMVFLTKLGFENLKNLVTLSPFCKDDDFCLKRPNHHLVPKYVHLFRARKVWYMGRLF